MRKLTVRDIISMKYEGRPIAMITAYDYPFARLVDRAGVDIVLVGDSLGMVVYGYPSTHRVSISLMARHTEAVAKAITRALVVTDMPFGSYEASTRDAIYNAIRLVKCGAEAVKLEGGEEVADIVHALTRAGIPVMGHIGLTPQRYLALGGYRKRGKTRSELESLLSDAKALEDSGAFAVVIEYTAEEAAREITKRLSIPTICIGSGRYCDGQVLVIHDILGLSEHIPPFAKVYANLSPEILSAVKNYVSDVKSRRFPEERHVFHMKESVEGD